MSTKLQIVASKQAGPTLAEQQRTQSCLLSQRRTLEMIADGAELTAILEQLCRTIDAQQDNVISSVLLADSEGKQLWPAAGPRVPDGWTKEITPLPIAANIGSCGSANETGRVETRLPPG